MAFSEQLGTQGTWHRSLQCHPPGAKVSEIRWQKICGMLLKRLWGRKILLKCTPTDRTIIAVAAAAGTFNQGFPKPDDTMANENLTKSWRRGPITVSRLAITATHKFTILKNTSEENTTQHIYGPSYAYPLGFLAKMNVNTWGRIWLNSDYNRHALYGCRCPNIK